MTAELFNDETANPPLRRHVGIWDDHPRFLGMFDSKPIPPGKETAAPRVGYIDHFVTCRGCGAHPVLLAVGIYVRISGRVYSVIWPTWFKVP